MAEPRYDPEVDAWLDTLVEHDPDLLSRIEDEVDLLREEPLGARARRRAVRSDDGFINWVLSFEFRGQPYVLVWTTDPEGKPAVLDVIQTDAL